MKRWAASLAGRITLVTTAVAVVAVLVTGGVAFPLIRTAAVDQARSELAEQADAFSATPLASLTLEQRQRRLDGTSEGEVVVVSASGVVSGDTAGLVSAAVVARLVAGESVSLTLAAGAHPGTPEPVETGAASTAAATDRAAGRTLLEGRPIRDGGAIVLTRSLATVDAASGVALLRLGVALAAGLVFAVLLGLWLARRLSRPLAEAAITARRLAAGERNVPAPPAAARSASEVAEVTAALGTLDTALMTSETRQREFLLSVSHDIRSPLTALRGYAEALADGLVSPADLPTVGATLVSETERLNRFVSDLLELARLEADDFALDAHPFDLVALTRSAELAWRARCESDGIVLVFEASGRPAMGSTAAAVAETLTAVTDPQRVRQIIDGLVENAVRVTPAGASIVLAVGLERGVPFVEVRDGGPGLSADDLAVVFERGTLHAKYRDDRPVGSGLGLSIAARLAGRLGAELTAGSAPEGGASFRLLLPLSALS
ncbi:MULTISPECIES: sensor histidine kinase [Subtercola]|uniref:histidine kinase n=1 Tax=Subtercola vilae TaxID=2056433 RepID=A0A4V4RFS0_9MICO|nr:MULTISPECIES: HAMP domain-containing sensor histidine kinase [Subtercola]MEA9984800.1 HAMP domain-containing sensor histidine kinase [Subtercola sp. RTI3]TIH38974.1 sensor histidine kinase [Subtercola vilae]